VLNKRKNKTFYPFRNPKYVESSKNLQIPSIRPIWEKVIRENFVDKKSHLANGLVFNLSSIYKYRAKVNSKKEMFGQIVQKGYQDDLKTCFSNQSQFKSVSSSLFMPVFQK
jgi:hypothetical protein